MTVMMVPMVPENAYYDMAVQYIAFAPWAIWGALWVAYVVTREGAYWVVSWGVTLSSVPLYLLLVYFDDVSPGLLFPFMERWSFPNLEIAAVSSFFIFVLFFRVYYKLPVSYFQWFFLGVFFLIPPIVHLAAAGTAFWKVAISVTYGILSAILICVLMWTNQKAFVYLFTLPYFWTWFKRSKLLRDEKVIKEYKRLKKWRRTEYERARASSGLLAGPSSILLSKYGSTTYQ